MRAVRSLRVVAAAGAPPAAHAPLLARPSAGLARRALLVGAPKEVHEDLRAAQRRVFGELPKRQPETPRSGRRVLRGTRRGASVYDWYSPWVREYKFASWETPYVEEMWDREQFLNKIGKTSREGKLKPFRDVLNQRLKSLRFNEDLQFEGASDDEGDAAADRKAASKRIVFGTRAADAVTEAPAAADADAADTPAAEPKEEGGAKA